jgi:hypothetical protein
MGQVRNEFVRYRESQMSAVALAKGWLLSFPRKPTDTKQRWFENAAGYFGIHPRKAKKLFYDEIDRMDGDELLTMCRQFMRLDQASMKRKEILNELESLARTAVAEARNQALAQG